MQFFPAFAQPAQGKLAAAAAPKGSRLAAAAEGSASGLKDALQKNGKSLNFAALLGGLDADLKEYNPDNTLGIAAGFKSVKDDKSRVKTRDLNFLESKLRQNGVDEGVLQNFMAGLYTSTVDLPSIGRILGQARDLGRSGEALNEQEKIAFSGLMQRIGFDSEEIAEMEELSYQGKGLQVLKNIEQKLAGQSSAGQSSAGRTGTGQGEMLNLTREELATLSKLFNLSEKNAQAVMQQLGDQAELSLSKQDFSKLFAAGKVELDREDGEFSRIRQLAPGIVREMLHNSKLAESRDVNADNRGSRKLERSEIIMRQGATLDLEAEEEDGNRLIRGKSILTELGAKAEKNAAERDISDGLRQARNDLKEVPSSRTEEGGEDKSGHSGRETREGRRETFGDTLKQDADKAFRNNSENATLHERAGRETTAPRPDGAGIIFAPSGPAGQSAAGLGQGAGGQDARAAAYHERLFEQVEQGIIRNASNGARQITLRLDPPDLGRLTLNLTVNNGEVKALLRADQAETAQAVSDQLAALRSSLEEQGFKVTSLDVETRAQNQSNMENFSSAEQHNKEQQLEARANFIRLARSRAKEGETLARNMQSTDQPATISEAGLHLIA